MPDVKQAVGGYEILRELGRGGMATVYLARQVDLDRLVALKELSALGTSDPSFAKRFLREAQLSGSLSHPNIVTVYDFFGDRGIPYIAMEYLERGSLRPYVGRMSLAQIGGVLEGVLAGLAPAEKRQIVHRDLKPENLLVTADGRIKIADFGIAKATNDLRTGTFLTSTGVAVGTPNYMAPEQATAQGVGPWTDLYSVGVMAFEFLVGRPPFGDTDNALGVLLRQVNEEIPAVSDLDPGIDATISDWIARMVAKEPAERPESPTAAWEELEDTFLALLGPRWRREARLTALPDLPSMPPGPATPPPFGAPTGPLTEAHLGALIGSFEDPRQAATVPPRVSHAPPTAATARAPAKRRGRSAARLFVGGVALVAAAAAILGRADGSQTPPPSTSPQSSPATSALPAPAPASASPQQAVDSPPQSQAGKTDSSGGSLVTEGKNAGTLAAQYEKAASQIATQSAARVAGSPTARLVAALRRAAAVYRAAAAAASAGNLPGYAAAIQTATARRQEVQAATSALRAAQSNPTQPSQPTQPVPRTPCSGDSVSDDPSDEGC
jgi:serine/threonine protein kinase